MISNETSYSLVKSFNPKLNTLVETSSPGKKTSTKTEK